jgi:hypothetical protein
MNATALPLRDIHLPDGVAWFPPAPLWWLLVLLLLVLVVFAVSRLLRYRRLQRQQRSVAQCQQAIRDDIHAIGQQFNQSNDAAAACRAVSQLLRRVCLSRFPREDFAALHGEAWLAYLRQQQAWPQARQALLLELPYQPKGTASADDVRRLLRDAEDWMVAVMAQHD